MPKVSRAEALTRLELERVLYPSRSRLYLSLEPLMPERFRLALGEVEPEYRPHPGGSWVGLLDILPDASWPHKAVYLLIDHDGTLRSFDARWFPHAWKLDFRAESDGEAA